MKKLFITLSIVVTTQLLVAQQYPFPKSDAIWSVYDEKYFTSGDSVLNGKSYIKIFIVKDSVLSIGTHFALIREDTTLGKVFVVDTNSNVESLLYDFNVSVGDTIDLNPYLFYLNVNTSVHVTQIDSINISGNYRKRIKVEGFYGNGIPEEYWIEGIGSTAGLFSSGIIGFTASDVTYPELFCFEYNNVILYQDSARNNCYEKRTIGLLEHTPNSDFYVYPNPIRGSELNLSLPFLPEKEVLVKIYSLTGQLVEKHLSSHKESHIRLDLNLPGGTYLIQVEHNEYQATRRVIVLK